MKKGNYVVSRNSIYIGTVIKVDKESIVRDKNNKLKIFSFCRLRNIIFTPNNQGYAKDLLYSSPSYPILNMANDKPFSHNEDFILIHDIYNLNELLNYLGYNSFLTHEDILNLRRKIFNGKFVQMNPNLFGWQEIDFEKLEFYRNGKKITDPKEIEKRKWQLLTNRQKSEFIRTFIRYNDKLKEFEDIINSKSDNSILDVIFHGKYRRNTFTPHPQEGRIKKLK